MIDTSFSVDGGVGGGGKKGAFAKLGLSDEIQRGLSRKGYRKPTPIQREAIPVILKGVDVVAMARTGSGKTAAFLLPIFQLLGNHSPKVGARALILSPTRELAMQTHRFVRQLGKFTELRASLLVGGESFSSQFDTLSRNPDIIVATPGRLMHIVKESDLGLSAVKHFVCDEADRLFEMGFADQIRDILTLLAPSRQTLLFSATLPKALAEFTRAGLRDPTIIRLDGESQISPLLELRYYTVRSKEKTGALLFVLREILAKNEQVLVFCPTRYVVEYLWKVLLACDIQSAMVFGTMDQYSRKLSLNRFRANEVKVLFVTDLAARGLDIPLLDNVVNFNFPSKPKTFVHRVGRVARAGRSGTAYSLICPDEFPYLLDVHLMIGQRLVDADKAPKSKVKAESSDVYYGAIPRSLLDDDVNFVTRLVAQDDEIAQSVKTCGRAENLYNKTRSAASPASAQRAKSLKPELIHPIFADAYSENERVLDKFITSISSYRPSRTIFEIGKQCEFMANKRRVHSNFIATTQKKISAKVASDAIATEEAQSSSSSRERKLGDEGDVAESQSSSDSDDVDRPPTDTILSSSFLYSPSGSSKARPLVDPIRLALSDDKQSSRTLPTTSDTEEQQGSKKSRSRKKKRQRSLAQVEEGESSNSAASMLGVPIGAYRDSKFFVATEPTNFFAKDETLNEFGAPQKSERIEDFIHDVNADDMVSMTKKRQVTKWDSKKKKYRKVQQGEDVRSAIRRERNEAGARVKRKEGHSSKFQPYKKWQQKTNKQIGAVGEFEDDNSGSRRSSDHGDGDARGAVDDETRWGGAKKYRHTKSSIGAAKFQKKSDLNTEDVIRKKRKEKLKQSTRMQKIKEKRSKIREKKRSNPKVRKKTLKRARKHKK